MIPTWRTLPVSEYEPQDDDVIIRQSTIGSMLLCEKRVEYTDTPGYLEPVSEAMAFGTCTHHMCEQDLLGGNTLELVSNMREWVEPILVEQYDWSIAQITKPLEFFSELGVAYRTWLQQVKPKLKQDWTAVEQEMFLPLGEANGRQIALKGTPDLVYEDRIIDFKTTGRMWKKAKADVSIQASLYMALTKQNTSVSPRKFVFWIYDRSKSKWHRMPVERRVIDIEAALRTAYDFGRKIEAKTFTAQPVPETFTKKRGWYCSAKYCSAWNVCQYKYLSDDVDEREVAVRSW